MTDDRCKIAINDTCVVIEGPDLHPSTTKNERRRVFLYKKTGLSLDWDLVADAIQQQACDLDELRSERDGLTDVLYRAGFTKCDIPACNCGSWHHRYGLPERMRDIKDELSNAGYPCDNSNGWLPINALRQLISERDRLAELAKGGQ